MIRQRYTTLSIVEKFKQVHGNKYDYSLVEYKTMHIKVKIICKNHGVFEQLPNTHLNRKYGCPKCSFVRNSKKQRSTTKDFILKSKSIFKNLYTYDKTVYGLNAHEKVIITCKEHGDFKITPNTHLSKKIGCLACRKLNSKKREHENCGWTRTNFINRCKNKKARLYIIRCYNEKEEFFKIGITSKKVSYRFRNKILMPYNYKVELLIKSTDAGFIYDLENKLLKSSKKFKYEPLLPFHGSKLECRKFTK